jgi:hypothetical protein
MVWMHQQALALLRQVLPRHHIHRQMAYDLQTPEEFDALEQRKCRRRVRPVIPRELFISKDRPCLPQMPEDMRIMLERCGAFEGLQRLTIIATRDVGMTDGVIGIEIAGIAG